MTDETPSALQREADYLVPDSVQSTDAAIAPDGSWLAVAYRSFGNQKHANRVLVWDVARWQAIATLEGCSGHVDGVACSTNGQLVCVGGDAAHFMSGEITSRTVTTSDDSEPQLQLRINGKPLLNLRRAAISPQGVLATGSALAGDGDKLQLWDSSSGETRGAFGQLAGDVSGMAFSPDGDQIAVGVGSDRSVSVWSVSDQSCLWKKRAHTAAHQVRVAYAPDGRLLATCGDKNVALHRAENGKSHKILKGHASDVYSIAFSSTGDRLFSGSWGELRVWSMPDGQAMQKHELPGLLPQFLFTTPNHQLIVVHSVNDELTLLRYRMDASADVSITPPVVIHDQTTPARGTRLRDKPRSSEEQRLWKAVLAAPDDDGPRLAFAAWLAAKDDRRAEFIRLQLEIDALSSVKLEGKQKSRRTKLVKQTEEILSQHFLDWTSHLSDLELRRDQVEFRRGWLSKLSLNDVDVNDETLAALRHAPEIECLDLSGTAVTDAGVRELTAVSCLQELILGETAVTPSVLQELKSLRRLVVVDHSEWGNQPLAEREAWKQTRNRRFARQPKERQRAEAIRALRAITGWLPQDQHGQFSSVSLSQSWSSDGDLIYLQALPEIEELDLFECRAITASGLKHLAKLPNLRRLRLTETGVTDLAPLGALRQLEELHLDSLEDLDPTSFCHLAKLEHLQVLTVRYCQLGDEILAHIARCGNLQEIDLIYNNFTTDGLQQLRGLRNLKSLDFDGKRDHPDLLKEVMAPRSRSRKS